MRRMIGRMAGLRVGLLVGLLAFVVEALPAQSGGLQSSGVATPGGSIVVEVASNDRQIDVLNAATGEVTRHDVPPGKSVTVPIPPVPPGTVLILRAGRGRRASWLVIEVVAPSP